MVADSPDWTKNINIVGATVTINVAITSSSATINVNIASTSGNVNVNLNASSINLNINFANQSAPVQGFGDYQSVQGGSFFLRGTASIAQGTSTQVATFNNTTTVTLFVEGCSFALVNLGAQGYIILVLINNGTTVVNSGAIMGDSIIFKTPLPVPAGTVVSINIIAGSSVLGNLTVFASLWGVFH